MPSPGPAEHAPYIDHPLLAWPHLLCYPDLSSHIIARPAFDLTLHLHPDVFEKIIHPYDSDAFEYLLAKHDLASAYPLLPTQLRHGFPLGTFPIIRQTFIHKSPFFSPPFVEAIYEYLDEETSSGRMSGPFTVLEVERILRGPFICSPFTVATQTQGPGLPDKIRVCRNLSKASSYFPSVNSFIRKEDFPVRIDTAFRVADIVCFHPSLATPSFSHSFSHPLPTNEWHGTLHGLRTNFSYSYSPHALHVYSYTCMPCMLIHILYPYSCMPCMLIHILALP